jgi:Na+/H+ antiporter NhaD/arsenite permease-like protein
MGIAAVLIAYFVSAVAGLPQKAAALHQVGDDRGNEVAAAQVAPAGEAADEHPPYWTVLPFVVLLGLIAVLPLVPATAHWWESNRHKFFVAAALALATLVYYLFFHVQPLEGHWPGPHVTNPSSSGLNVALTGDVLATAVLGEYIPFMLLLFSLYTISGGIRVDGDLPAHPLTNSVILAVGGLLASLIGTTGAAMLLIRLLLETNRERKHVSHTVVFFIFIVCNCGGCLLPIGDPPLFLGYLRGVDFLWTLKLWPEWLFVNSLLIASYYLLDRFWHYPRETAADIQLDETQTQPVTLRGWWPNALLLVAVVVVVAVFVPGKALPGTNWHPWLYLREMILLGLVGLSLVLGDAGLRRANQFDYGAVAEVAALFFGIFICMQPALQILDVRGPYLGLATPAQFFWATGGLSSVLDNAPTYVVFFETAKTLGPGPTVARLPAEPLLAAISLGAVFMGAATYIGNGPNFMVKAVAEKAGVRMPSFFGYLVYSGLILLPVLALTAMIFL